MNVYGVKLASALNIICHVGLESLVLMKVSKSVVFSITDITTVRILSPLSVNIIYLLC